MSKPYRDASSGVGLDVVVTLPADVCERIKQEAKERRETFDGWRRAELVAAVEVECTAEVPPEELAFDVRQALAKAPATKRLDDLAVQTLAERYAVLPAPGEEGLPRGGSGFGLARSRQLRRDGRAWPFRAVGWPRRSDPTGRAGEYFFVHESS